MANSRNVAPIFQVWDTPIQIRGYSTSRLWVTLAIGIASHCRLSCQQILTDDGLKSGLIGPISCGLRFEGHDITGTSLAGFKLKNKRKYPALVIDLINLFVIGAIVINGQLIIICH